MLCNFHISKYIDIFNRPLEPSTFAWPPTIPTPYPCMNKMIYHIGQAANSLISLYTKNYYIYFLNFLLQKKNYYKNHVLIRKIFKDKKRTFSHIISVLSFPFPQHSLSNYNNKVAMQSMRSLKATMIRLITCKLRIRSLEWNTFVILCTAGYNPQNLQCQEIPEFSFEKMNSLHTFTILLTIFAYLLAYCVM